MRALLLTLLVSATGCAGAMAADDGVPMPSGGSGSGGAIFDRELMAELAGASGQTGRRTPAKGSVKLRFDREGGLVYTLDVANPSRETFTAAHIHRGRPGSHGPAVVTLFGGAQLKERFVEVRGTASREGLTAELAQEIATSPGAFYLAIHSVRSPAAALEGSIR